LKKNFFFFQNEKNSFTFFPEKHIFILILSSFSAESPDEPRIFDAQGKEVTSVAGPFREGHELFLSCSVTGGNFHFNKFTF
jgi:hypothetical protein